MENNLSESNKELIRKFGATPIDKLSEKPDFYTFKTGVLVSHRDFDKYFHSLKKGEKCAIVSGLNASGSLHLGHKAVFDTNLFFQKKYNLPVFIPISDDESYVSGKVKTQEEALENSKKLARELLAYGFNPNKTFFIIDQIYTNIYNLAFKLSKKITLSEIKATYGYENEDNPGLYFYPAVQSAHILFPQEKHDIPNVLVPIGPDEDAHIRICRDIASRFDYKKPAILHSNFLPGIDGEKMSKSRNNAIFLNDDEKTIRKKISKAFSGGQPTIKEQEEKGANIHIDVSCIYLNSLFHDEDSEKAIQDYKEGKILTKDIKDLFAEKAIKFIKEFQSNLKKISEKDLEKSILRNKS